MSAAQMAGSLAVTADAEQGQPDEQRHEEDNHEYPPEDFGSSCFHPAAPLQREATDSKTHHKEWHIRPFVGGGVCKHHPSFRQRLTSDRRRVGPRLVVRLPICGTMGCPRRRVNLPHSARKRIMPVRLDRISSRTGLVA